MTLPPMPQPDTHCLDDDTGKDVWSHSADQMRAYAELAVAAERAEIERLRTELANVNNEFGSQTADWPDAWKRVADLKQLLNDRWREAERLRAALRKVAQAHAWLAFGDCRSYGSALEVLSPSEADELARAALKEKP